MRQIKFRAWDKLEPNKLMTFDLTERDLNVAFLAENCVIMQFTGLLDKNGKEIYEGDIVKCFDTSGGEVYNHLIELPLFFQEIWCETEWDEVKKVRKNKTKVEIIGNIYEDSNLLENK